MGLSILQKVTPVIMKVLFIAATLALASAGFAPSCEECNAAAAGLLARLTSADSIAEQTGILISQVCPQAADAAACEEGLATWWSYYYYCCCCCYYDYCYHDHCHHYYYYYYYYYYHY